MHGLRRIELERTRLQRREKNNEYCLLANVCNVNYTSDFNKMIELAKWTHEWMGYQRIGLGGLDCMEQKSKVNKRKEAHMTQHEVSLRFAANARQLSRPKRTEAKRSKGI